MKPFDLEKALAGEPVVLRNGNKAFVKFALENPVREECAMIGYVIDDRGRDSLIGWYKNGLYASCGGDGLDIIGMYEEPRPTVTLTLPSPITYPEENKRCYTIVINDVDAYDGDGSFVSISDWVAEKENGDYDYQTKQRIREGLLFATEEDAQAWLDALKNARR
ncbi:pyruvate kinase [Pasteurella multocida]